MKPSVYIETSIIGYLTTRLSNLLVAASNQQITRQWWDDHRDEFELFVSRFVADECSRGDRAAADERLEKLSGISWLDVTEEVINLAEALQREIPLPKKAEIDSYHVAVTAVHGVQYLLTLNCRHIANASLRPKIESICRDLGYEPPIICTPQELMDT